MVGTLTIHAPVLIIYEVANALRYRSDITKRDLESDIEALFLLDITFIVPSSKSMERAASEARRLNVSVYDAVYLSLANDIGCPLITADSELCTKAQNTGLLTLLKDY